MERQALKVKIVRGSNGKFQYPNFDSLPSVVASGLPWNVYTEVYCDGWKYDQVDGMNSDTLESPFGEHFALLLAPADFVTEAVAALGSLCTKLSDAGATTYYETRISVDQPTEKIDTDIIMGLNAKVAAGKTLTAEQNDMLDGATSSPGIRANEFKTWAQMKSKKNIIIKN